MKIALRRYYSEANMQNWKLGLLSEHKFKKKNKTQVISERLDLLSPAGKH